VASQRPADRAVRPHVPQAHRPVIGAGGQRLAVAAERHSVHATLMPGERRADRGARQSIPQPQRAVPAGRGQGLAVGAERDIGHEVLVADERTLISPETSKQRQQGVARLGGALDPIGLDAQHRPEAGILLKRDLRLCRELARSCRLLVLDRPLLVVDRLVALDDGEGREYHGDRERRGDGE
jgi:hypothetical protein